MGERGGGVRVRKEVRRKGDSEGEVRVRREGEGEEGGRGRR